MASGLLITNFTVLTTTLTKPRLHSHKSKSVQVLDETANPIAPKLGHKHYGGTSVTGEKVRN